MKTAIKNIIPRHSIRCPDTVKYWKRKKNYQPLRVVYAKDLDKYILMNGHHRLEALKQKGIKIVNITIERVQEHTTFDKYGRPQSEV